MHSTRTISLIQLFIMKRFLKNNLIVFSVFSFSLFSVFSFKTVSASSYDDKIISDIENFVPSDQYNPEYDLNVTEKTLGIGKIKILPDNMFYFLNDIRTWAISTFALSKNDQTSILFKSSSERLKELEKCVSLSEEKCIDKGLENYNQSKNEIYTKINKFDNQEKNNITQQITELEINHYTLLNNIRSIHQSDKLDKIIENNLQNYSKFIKSLSDNVTLKKNLKTAIEDTTNGKLKYILTNKYLETFKNYLNLEKREIINQVIEENYTELIKNINLIDIKTVEKTLQYYFYKTNHNSIFEEINLIDYLYSLQDKVENSPNKENIKIAILNTKQIPISIFNREIESLDIKESEAKLEKMFNTGEIQKINLIELLNKYNDGKKDIKTYQLEEIQDKNLLSLYNKIKITEDLTQKEKTINDTLDQISPENQSLAIKILDQIQLDNSSDINTKILTDRIKEQRGLNTIDTETEDNTICSFIYNPVCGENGVVYSNKCFAEKIGVKALYKGECKILENDKLKEITEKEIEQGWYYGDKTQKKPGTPTTWININSDTKSAKWINPKKATNLKGLTE